MYYLMYYYSINLTGDWKVLCKKFEKSYLNANISYENLASKLFQKIVIYENRDTQTFQFNFFFKVFYKKELCCPTGEMCITQICRYPEPMVCLLLALSDMGPCIV